MLTGKLMMAGAAMGLVGLAAPAMAGHRPRGVVHVNPVVAVTPVVRHYVPAPRRVVIPARYETVYRKVWVEPVYEIRTVQVWVPHDHGKGLHLAFGSPKFQFGLDLGKSHAGHGHYESVRRKVLVRPGYWETVAEQVLVSPERVEVVYNRGPRF